jgi:hypothetical protein
MKEGRPNKETPPIGAVSQGAAAKLLNVSTRFAYSARPPAMTRSRVPSGKMGAAKNSLQTSNDDGYLRRPVPGRRGRSGQVCRGRACAAGDQLDCQATPNSLIKTLASAAVAAARSTKPRNVFAAGMPRDVARTWLTGRYRSTNPGERRRFEADIGVRRRPGRRARVR